MKHRSYISPVARYYWQRVRAYPAYVTGILFAVPLTALVNSYLPALVVANVLSRLSSRDFESGQLWASFGPELVLYGAFMIGGIGMWRIVDYFTWRLEARIQRDIAQQVFRHMVVQTADFHANNFGGSLVSQNSKLMGGYIRVADTTIYQTLSMLFGIVIVSIIVWPRSPQFVLVFIAFAIAYLAVAMLITRPVQKAASQHAALESKQTGALADAITNVMTIKSFGRRKFEEQRFAKATQNTFDSIMHFTRLHQRQMNWLGLANRLISVSSLVMAVISVMVFNANIGTVFLILSYTGTVVQQLFEFSNNGLRNYNRAFGDAADMVKILGQTPVVLDPAEPEPVRIKDGAIELDAVSFTHNGAHDAIFDKLDLKIKPGEKVGLVGHSGSGKTTFTRLLMRFSDLDGGAIKIDGQNIAAITQDELHSHIAYVPQEPLLFHRTIAENIGYGDLTADAKAVTAVAKLAHADDFIVKLPKGYDTLVGERGVKLSGGQRQRVAIARAMLKNAPILLLDEATSALDSESEALIQDALWKLMEGRTAIVIAHRLSTIQHMDRIVVLSDGQIVEQGSHKQLLKHGGAYAKLWERQSGGFMDD